MKTKIGRGLLALLVCVQVLGRATIGCLAFRSSSVPSRASNITKGCMARRTILMSDTVTACYPVSGFRVR